MTDDGSPLDWRSSLAVRNHSPTGPAWGYGGSSPAQLAPAFLLSVTDEATAERCQTQVAVDVRLPLPAVCPDCGADVLARADIEGPAAAGRPPFNALRLRRTKL